MRKYTAIFLPDEYYWAIYSGSNLLFAVYTEDSMDYIYGCIDGYRFGCISERLPPFSDFEREEYIYRGEEVYPNMCEALGNLSEYKQKLTKELYLLEK